MSNNRIFYPVHMVAMKASSGNLTFAEGDEVHGIQSMSMTTNFNIERTNELGTQSIYSNVEGIPEVEVSLSKVLDGHPTPYMLSTQHANEPTLIARSAVRCDLAGAIFGDTKANSTGSPESVVAISGAYVDSISYNFTTDGNFTEDTTFVANDKLWFYNFAGGNTSTGVPGYGNEGSLKPGGFGTLTWNAAIPLNDSPLSTLGIATSQDFNFELPTGTLSLDANLAVNHEDCTVMPTEIAGFTTSGTNPKVSGVYQAHVSSFTASVSLGREDILELGHKGPYYRAANFPVEVTSELQATAAQGDLVSALDGGIFGTGVGQCSSAGYNTKDRTIRVVLCQGFRLYLGTKNRLQSVGYSGGDADGGNVTISYTYTNFNDFTVMDENDPGDSANGGVGVPGWTWNSRGTYLTS